MTAFPDPPRPFDLTSARRDGREPESGGDPIILAIDIGLTNAKAVLFTLDGRVVDREAMAYPTQRPSPGRAEQDPEDWWNAVVQASHRLWERGPSSPSRLVGLGVTAHMHGLVCLGKDGHALLPAMVLGDRRAQVEATELEQAIGAAEIRRITGTAMDPSMPAAKLAWLRRNERSAFLSTWAFGSARDWFVYRLVGQLLTDAIDACATSLFDLTTGRWSSALCAEVGVDPARLPAIVDGAMVAGPLHPAAAAAIGIPGGLPVAVGSGDDIEVIGNGLLTPGESLEHLGTTGSILSVVSSARTDPLGGVELYPHAVPGLWVAGGSITAAGSAITFARDLLRMKPSEVRLAIERHATPRAEDPVFIPSLAGERSPFRAPTATGAWLGLSFDSNRYTLMSAVFRGVSYSLKRILDRIEELHGEQARLTVSGRQSADDTWVPMRADSYGKTLSLLETPEPTALGVMQLTATAVGAYAHLTDAVKATVRYVGTVSPDPDRAEAVERDFRRFVELVAAVGPAGSLTSEVLRADASTTEIQLAPQMDGAMTESLKA